MAGSAIDGMAGCAGGGAPLSSPAPLAHRCAAAGLDSGTPAELLASMPFDGAVDRLQLAGARDLPGIGGGGRSQFGHDLNLQIAVLQLPFIVLLEQYRADQPNDGGLIGEDADDIGAPLDLFVEPLERVGAV